MTDIHKTIKSEMNESLIPAIGKVVNQSINSFVTKPLQTALVKNSKESSQLRTKEVVEAITENIREPVSNVFEEVRFVFFCVDLVTIH